MFTKIVIKLFLLNLLNFFINLCSAQNITLIPCATEPPPPPQEPWLEQHAIGVFKIWHIIFSGLFTGLAVVIVLCCLFRCRIPRTKQEIEADAIRKKMTNVFRSHLNRIKVEELDISSNNLLPVLQKVEKLEVNRMNKQVSFDAEKLNWTQKIRKMFAMQRDMTGSSSMDETEISGKFDSFEGLTEEEKESKKRADAERKEQDDIKMKEVTKTVENVKIDSGSFNVISDQMLVLMSFESEKDRKKREKLEKKQKLKEQKECEVREKLERKEREAQEKLEKKERERAEKFEKKRREIEDKLLKEESKLSKNKDKDNSHDIKAQNKQNNNEVCIEINDKPEDQDSKDKQGDVKKPKDKKEKEKEEKERKERERFEKKRREIEEKLKKEEMKLKAKKGKQKTPEEETSGQYKHEISIEITDSAVEELDVTNPLPITENSFRKASKETVINMGSDVKLKDGKQSKDELKAKEKDRKKKEKDSKDREKDSKEREKESKEKEKERKEREKERKEREREEKKSKQDKKQKDKDKKKAQDKDQDDVQLLLSPAKLEKQMSFDATDDKSVDKKDKKVSKSRKRDKTCEQKTTLEPKLEASPQLPTSPTDLVLQMELPIDTKIMPSESETPSMPETPIEPKTSSDRKHKKGHRSKSRSKERISERDKHKAKDKDKDK